MIPSTKYSPQPIQSWSDFMDWYSQNAARSRDETSRWIFRGEGSNKWSTTTSIERQANVSGIPLPDLPKREKRLIREFRRHAHNYFPDVPARADIVEWLSLMAHYGAPTRLLDWTYSPFVAAFFAVEAGTEPDCRIWAMDSRPYSAPVVAQKIGEDTLRSWILAETSEETIEAHIFSERIIQDPTDAPLPLELPPEPNKARQFLLVPYFIDKRPTPGLLTINPFRRTERLVVQQGVFLMPTDLTKSFEDNLLEYDQPTDNLTSLNIALTPEVRKDFLFHLHRMNINRATLFPGLQGYSESLRVRLALPEALSY